MRCALGTVEPLDVPQSPADLLLLELLLGLLPLLLSLEVHIAVVLYAAVDGARHSAAEGRAGDARRRKAAPRPAVLEAVEGAGRVSAVEDATLVDVPLLRGYCPDELIFVRNLHDAPLE